jgi:hypothetical protein
VANNIPDELGAGRLPSHKAITGSSDTIKASSR